MSKSHKVELSKKMRVLSARQSPDVAMILCKLADELDDAVANCIFSSEQGLTDQHVLKKMVAVWARARQYYGCITKDFLV